MHARAHWKKTVIVIAALGATMITPAVGTASETSYSVPGLENPVDVTVDKWGVPHISASGVGDLYHAQGFNAARDRLFQLDTWRRRGLGKLSEVLGPEFVDQDRAARMFLYRGDIQQEWDSYGPQAKEAATRFAKGINAYVDWLAENPDAMPTEFQKLGYKPAHWRPEDVVRIRTHAIGQNLSDEVTRAKLMCEGGAKAAKALHKLEPAHEPKAPGGLDPCSIPDDVLDVFNLATADVSFDPGEGQMTTLSPEQKSAMPEGSNSWALSGDRTKTNRPILASDPHREAMGVPSGRYIQHLSAPGMNVIGAGEPWNPGIAIGHNEDIAFGLTVFSVDQQDLYVYELDPNDPTKYRYGDGWEKMKSSSEEIPVKGGGTEKVNMSFTRHGPVVKVDEENNRAYAVRSVWSKPGTSAYLASLDYQNASNYDEFTKAMQRWGAPGENLIYADKHGDIGRVTGGFTPKRTGENYDGLLPVPGDGRYEWDGFHSNDELPRDHNPSNGMITSANEYSLPEDPSVVPGYEWQEPDRKERIDQVLSEGSDHTVEGSLKLQQDEMSLFAKKILPYVKDLQSEDPATQKAIALLSEFDGVASADSSPAALYETWLSRHLHPAWTRSLPEAAAKTLEQQWPPDHRPMLESFENPDEWFGENGAAKRDKLILETLTVAFHDVSEQLGDDPAAWSWGELNHQLFMHPLGGPNVGPFPMGGDFHSINPSWFIPTNYQKAAGATFRMVVDVGDWDKSRAINAPGQSGDERSPHYDDLAKPYANGESFPMVFSADAIEANAEQHIRLEPK